MKLPELERALRALGNGAGVTVNGEGFSVVVPDSGGLKVVKAGATIADALQPMGAAPATQDEVMIPVSDIIAILQRWYPEWEKWCAERDATPLNHAHRRIHEGMCNTYSARIADIHDLLKKHGVLRQPNQT